MRIQNSRANRAGMASTFYATGTDVDAYARWNWMSRGGISRRLFPQFRATIWDEGSIGMIMISEAQPRRACPVAFPCIACGSPTAFEQIYCASCLRAAAEQRQRDANEADAILERTWLRSEMERAA